MDAFSTPATEVVKASAALVGPQIDYIVHYKRYVKDLLQKAHDLSSMEEDVKQKVKIAKRKGDRINQVVERWLSKAEDIQKQTSDLSKESMRINSSFGGWCSAHCTVGKKAKKIIDVITILLGEGSNLGELSVPSTIQDMNFMPPEDFEAFESTKAAMHLVMEALMNDKINIIGVHGMGGVGKTTLMKKIAYQVKMTLFDVVVMVGVSQNLDLEKIQDNIAVNLGFGFGQETGDARAKSLCTRLEQERRVLIILDDLWNSVDFSKVGIPKSCKIVLTTRRQEVFNMMKSDMESSVGVPLGILSESDSWHLFRKNSGTYVDSPNLNDVARDVAKECKGLPVALVTLGKAMREKDQHEWEDVLLRLSESDYTYIEDMDERVYKVIKLSYDYLKYEEAKSVFLYCCLFPEDHNISMDELLWYVIGESLPKDVNLRKARRNLKKVVGFLTSAHLLQKAKKEEFVLMHDVIRDVAIKIASDDHGYVVKAGRRLESWPENEVLQKCTRLSLMGNGIRDLPERPEIPNIKTLTLSRCRSLQPIPDCFFEGLKSLVNLDLSHTPIMSLPSSLPCLVNLRSLCLDGCTSLYDISLIGKLRNLEKISLKQASITMLTVTSEFPHLKFFND